MNNVIVEGFDETTMQGTKIVKYHCQRFGNLLVAKIDGYEGEYVVENLPPNANVDDYAFLFGNNDHPNFLRAYYSVGRQHIIYDMYDRTLTQHMQNMLYHNKVDIVMVDAKILHSLGPDPRPYIVAPYVSELYRKIFQLLIELLQYIHSGGRCTHGFTINNFVMRKNVLKFYNAPVSRVSVLEKSDRVAKDYNYLRDMTIQLFQNHQIPVDMARWLDRLKNFNGDPYWMIHNVALSSSQFRITMIQNIFAKQCSIPQDKYDTLLEAMDDNSGWMKRIERKHGPLYKCLHSKKSEPYIDSPKKVANLHLLRFLRNFTVHFQQNMIGPKYKYDVKHIDAIVMNQYGTQICKFLEAAAKTTVNSTRKTAIEVLVYGHVV